jgi:glycerate kinase
LPIPEGRTLRKFLWKVNHLSGASRIKAQNRHVDACNRCATMRGMHVLIAADSFKDALPAREVCAAIARGLSRRSPPVQIVEFPLADGGEGTLSVLSERMGLHLVEMDAVDPLARPMRAPIGVAKDGSFAVIESATVSGLGLLTPAERSPLVTSTIGLGQLVRASHRLNVPRILMAIGGTATNDGGVGLAHALGWRFFDANGTPLSPSGAALARLARIVPPADPQPHIDIELLCDVANPLYGPQGAAQVYARQKGASEADIELLDTGLRRLAQCVAQQLPHAVDPHTPGAGAAGGLGFGAMVFLGARLRPGIETILDLTDFDSALAKADVVITGEGRLDAQTLHGKLIQGIAMRARRRGIGVIALCGQVSVTLEQLRSLRVTAYCIDNSESGLHEKLARTAENLTATAARIPLS